MIVTVAELNDIPELTELLAVLFAQEIEFEPNVDDQARGLRLIISDSSLGHILVARKQGKVVAMVNLLYTVSTALGGKVCLLEDMVVRPEIRGQGVGQELLSSAIEHARLAGCLRVTLLTDVENLSAQQFYQRAGFVLSSMVPMRLSLKTTHN